MTRVVKRAEGIDELLNLPTVKGLVTSAAGEIARDAATLAPQRTGHLSRSYKRTVAVREPGRVVATAYTDDMAGHLAEWGSVKNPPYAPLRRAAERSRLRTRLAPKGAL